MKRKIFFAINIIGLIALLFALFHIGAEEIFKSLQKSNANYISIALILYLIAQLFRCEKWFQLIKILSKEPFKISRKITYSAYFKLSFISNISPGKSGELSAPIIIQSSTDLDLKKATSVYLTDRINEAIFLVIFVIITALYLYQKTLIDIQLINPSYILIMMMILLTGLYLTITISRKTKIFGFFRSVLDHSKEILKNKSTWAFLPFMTLCAWAFEILSFHFFILSTSNIALIDSLTLSTVGILIAIASIVPGGIGLKIVGVTYLAHSLGYSTPEILMANTVGVVTTNILRYSLSLGADYFLKPSFNSSS